MLTHPRDNNVHTMWIRAHGSTEGPGKKHQTRFQPKKGNPKWDQPRDNVHTMWKRAQSREAESDKVPQPQTQAEEESKETKTESKEDESGGEWFPVLSEQGRQSQSPSGTIAKGGGGGEGDKEDRGDKLSKSVGESGGSGGTRQGGL